MNPIIKISQGQIKGLTATALSGENFYQFLNIPFGKIPKRFSDPLPADSWEGLKDCTEPGDICFQRNELKVIEGSENCLNLNVYTKSLSNEETRSPKPVMVWIHGGGFVLGSNQPMIYNPEYLLSEDIVLVTINYRLGFLGLLRIKNEQNENIGGNMMLKDQLEALKWVKNNIAYFNGDPNNVTLFGESAGSVSVHYHVLSPKSRGYFHKAIMQSGVSINHWADADCDIQDFSASQIAKLAGHNVKSETEALEVLRNLSLEEVLRAQFKWTKDNLIMCPCIEKPSENAFLTERPIDLITSGRYNKVPMILGYNSMEGLLFFSPIFPDRRSKGITVPFKMNPAIANEFITKLEKVYFEGRDNRIDGEIDFLSDSDFIYGILTSTETHARTNCYPVYLYKMTLDSTLNFFKRLSNLNFKGASHADDLGYLFNTIVNPPVKPGSVEEKYIQRFVKMWTNFATYGNPTPNNSTDPNVAIIWNAVTPKEINTLVIDKELTMMVDSGGQRMQVWKEVYQKHPSNKAKECQV